VTSYFPKWGGEEQVYDSPMSTKMGLLRPWWSGLRVGEWAGSGGEGGPGGLLPCARYFGWGGWGGALVPGQMVSGSRRASEHRLISSAVHTYSWGHYVRSEVPLRCG
jgi:hypothetical protein